VLVQEQGLEVWLLMSTLGYDDNGSTMTKTITNAGGSDTDEYSYDIANRLTEVKRNGTSLARYYYDPFGRRLSKEVSGVKTYLLYANEGLVGEYNSSGVLINSYMYLPDSMWGTQPLGMMTGGNSYFYQHDQLSTPNLLTSNTGQIKWQGVIDAFGQVQTTTSDINNPLRFPGQYADSETGLHYNYFRDYDPELGRYIQSDPIGLAGGINTYGYVGGNPISYVDPTGEIGLLGAGIGAGLDLLAQLAMNGGNIYCVSWWQVAGSAGLGAVGGIGASIGIAARTKALGHSVAGKSWSNSSKSWNAVSSRYRTFQNRYGNTPTGKWDAHHWYIERNSKVGKWLRSKFENADAFINHPLNLNPLAKGVHRRFTGKWGNLGRFNSIQKWWYGTPSWYKQGQLIGGAGGGVIGNTLGGECECGS